MTAISLILPERVLRELERRARMEGKTVDELVSEALMRQLDLADPESRAEVHLKLCEKYLHEAEELLRRHDYVQASEKAWGAASQAVKALAASRDLELRSHRELHAFIAKLERETGDPDIRRLWQSAASLHQNFYENWLPPEMVEGNLEDVRRLVEKFKELLHR